MDFFLSSGAIQIALPPLISVRYYGNKLQYPPTVEVIDEFNLQVP